MAADIFQLRGHGLALLGRGDFGGAVDALVTAAYQTHVTEKDYLSVLRPLADALAQHGDARSALTVLLYLAKTDGFDRPLSLLARVPPIDRARALAASGDHASAAREASNAGMLATAAIHLEKAQDFGGARLLWARLARAFPQGAGSYEAALVAFNLARCAKLCGDEQGAREAIVSAVGLLEEAADRFESEGHRERAFDCFQVLIEIGRESGMFEDVLEGFVNAIRILREDHLKYFVLQYFEEGIGAAKEGGELSAAATLAREAADYARAQGMGPASAHYVITQAELFCQVAAQHRERQAPPEIAENAILAAILAFAEVGQYARVGALYVELAHMDLEPARQRHYARASRRYEGVRDADLERTAPQRQQQRSGQPSSVWHTDLLEWEQRGSASEACAEILLDATWPDLLRRKALLTRLTAFAVEARPDDPSPAATGARVRLAEQLAQLQLYGVLSPLEALFAQSDRTVKVAVLGAMQQLFFKRTFITVQKGLRDPDPAVVEQATRAVEALKFQYAFDPLSRIYRASTDEKVRSAAVRAMTRIDTLEAAEFLLGVLDHGTQTDRASAIEGLRRAHGLRFVEVARSAMATAVPEVQGALRDILHARGIAA